MSEDCDFRLTYKTKKSLYTREIERRLLRNFRENLLDALRENSFEVEEDSVTVRNEGKFITFRVRYPSIYAAPIALKPYLALEFFWMKLELQQ